MTEVAELETTRRRVMLGLGASFLALPACTTMGVLEEPVPSLDTSKYAAIVVDASSGRVLLDASAEAPRFPASLTKMMTLYLLFETMDQGRVTRSSVIPVSPRAAAKPPTKIGFRRGGAIEVDAAIRALVVKSANDVACAVAEFLGGSEPQFAAMMTAKARALGMNRTVFRNASGLPDSGQISSARDMALLSIALRKNFPHHYHYFGQRDFSYGGRTIRGHNKLIGGVRGVDGIKTGYTRASGFNVATSVRRAGKDLVIVVMGAKSAESRNSHVAALIERYT